MENHGSSSPSCSAVHSQIEPSVRLRLLNGFSISLGDTVVRTPRSVQRVVALVALHDKPVQRGYIAARLWLDKSEKRAAANLRSALWRLARIGAPVMWSTNTQISIADNVTVDARQLRNAAAPLLSGSLHWEGCAALLEGDLLPGWDEEWVVAERERLRQLRLHGLEALAEQMTRSGNYGRAVEAALAVVAQDPLRESACRCLVQAHLAEGNVCEAIGAYDRYRRQLSDSLGISPSPAMERLAAPLRRLTPSQTTQDRTYLQAVPMPSAVSI